MLAGPIVDTLSYHWLFWIPFFLVVIAAVGTVFFVPESPIKAPGRVNWAGAALLSAWLVCLLVGISEGSRWGWADGRMVGLLAAAACGLAALASLAVPRPAGSAGERARPLVAGAA